MTTIHPKNTVAASQNSKIPCDATEAHTALQCDLGAVIGAAVRIADMYTASALPTATWEFSMMSLAILLKSVMSSPSPRGRVGRSLT
jgi:hypothetical protein